MILKTMKNYSTLICPREEIYREKNLHNNCNLHDERPTKRNVSTYVKETCETFSILSINADLFQFWLLS